MRLKTARRGEVPPLRRSTMAGSGYSILTLLPTTDSLEQLIIMERSRVVEIHRRLLKYEAGIKETELAAVPVLGLG